MNPRVIAAFVLLPLAVGLERFAYFASRAALYPRLESTGLDRMHAFGSSYGSALVGGVIGGALAVLLLPRVVLVAGGVAAAAGYFIIAGAHDPEWVSWGLRFAGAGAGAMKVCLYGLALLVLPTARLRLLYIALTYLVVNIAAAIGAPLGGAAASMMTPELVYVVAGVVVCVGLIPAVAYVVVDKLGAASAEIPRADQRANHDKAILGALVMALATLPLWAAMAAAGTRMWTLGLSAATSGVVQTFATLVTMATLVALGAWLLTRPRGGDDGDGDDARAPTSFLVGVALALGVGAALLACLPVAAAAVVATLTFGVAEVAAPLALGRGLANQHPRVVTLVAAFMLVFSAGGTSAGNAAGDFPVAILVVAAILCAAGGAALIALGNQLDAWLDAPRAPEPESWLNPQASSSQAPSSPS